MVPSTMIPTSDASRVLDRFRTVRAFVVGDAMHDEYHFGTITRISPEAPVPIFVPLRHNGFVPRPGGAANVVANLTALGVHTSTSFAALSSIKSRYMVGHQMVFRIDLDRYESPSTLDVDKAVGAFRGSPLGFFRRSPFDVLVLSDYAKGWLNMPMCRALIDIAREQGIPIVVDPKGIDWQRYQDATVICPNESEWMAKGESYEEPGNTSVLVKLGERGLVLYTMEDSLAFPAKARHVYDVTGAGDTVTATVAAVLGAGGTLKLACELAILTSGWVVGEVGTAVCPLDVLRDLILGSERDVQKHAAPQGR